jgi:phosphoribosylformylglycinamidine cyclo-ligase
VRLPSGITFGDAVLAPSAIYADVVAALYAENIPLSYISHITGHGLRKLMRASHHLSYRVTALPPVPEVFEVIVDVLGLTAVESYGTFNMGVGLALFCPAGSAADAVRALAALGYAGLIGGVVQDGPRRVVLEPAGLHSTTTT